MEWRIFPNKRRYALKAPCLLDYIEKRKDKLFPTTKQLMKVAQYIIARLFLLVFHRQEIITFKPANIIGEDVSISDLQNPPLRLQP